jgi:hypothetical protein
MDKDIANEIADRIEAGENVRQTLDGSYHDHLVSVLMERGFVKHNNAASECKVAILETNLKRGGKRTKDLVTINIVESNLFGVFTDLTVCRF